MATKYGTNATNLAASVPSFAGVGEQGGRVRVIYDKYTLTADLASGDVIYMGGKLPANARVIEVMLKFADLDASGGTLDVGWLASDDAVESQTLEGFISNADCTSADVILASQNQAAPSGIMKKFSSAVQVVVSTDGDTDATSGDIELAIMYVID